MVRTHGPPENVVVEECPDLVPGADEAVVDVRAASVNFPDVLMIADRYQVSVPPPFVPGSEFAGVVRAVGESVSNVVPGDPVAGATFVGAFAEQVSVRAAGLTPLAAGADFAAAASFWVTYGTAYHSLRSIASMEAGEWVVVLGAAGGVGLAAVDTAKALGGKVLAVASSKEKLALCRDRGADATVNYVAEDLKARIREITGPGADVVIDPVGGSHAEQALRSTRYGGRFIVVGFASGEIPRVPLNLVLLKGAIVRGFEMRSFAQHQPDALMRDRAELSELFASGRLRPYVSATYPLEQIGAALRHVADRHAVGKVVIEPYAPERRQPVV